MFTYDKDEEKFVPLLDVILDQVLTNEEIKISYEQIASLNLLHFSDKNIYSRGYRKLLHPSIQADFLEITKSVKSIIVVNMQNTDVLKNCKNNKDISFYFIFDNHNFVVYFSQYLSFVIFSISTFLVISNFIA
jgi:hypothetical protein